MKYAVIKTNSRQIKVQAGKPIWVDKLDVKIGDTYKFDNVLALNDGKELHIGNPHLNANVQATVQKHGKNKKLIIFRTKAKSNWKKKSGHRQEYTRLLIEEISLGSKSIDKASKKVEKDNSKTNKQTNNKKA